MGMGAGGEKLGGWKTGVGWERRIGGAGQGGQKWGVRGHLEEGDR